MMGAEEYGVATTALTEGITPGGSNITREKVAFRVEQFGDYVEYTDQLDLFDVDNIKSQFMDMVSKHQIIVLVGETGSGKTTQVIIIMYIYYALVNILSAHIIHNNLNTVYGHLKSSQC